MNKSSIKKVLFVCLIQVVIIGALSFSIFNKKETIFSPISKDTIHTIKTEKLNYFYELGSNKTYTANAEWLQHKVENTMNRDGLNERYNYPIRKEQGVFRIITLGDSYTYGMNVNTKDNWTELLEDRLNDTNTCKSITKYEVINLGVYGYDTQYEMERFRQKGKKYAPDLLIWTMFDYDRNLEEVLPIAESLNKLSLNQLRSLADGELRGGSLNIGQLSQEEIAFALALFRARNARIQRRESSIKYQKDLLNKFDLQYNGPILFVDLGKFEEKIPESIFNDRIVSHNNYLLETHLLQDKNLTLPDRHLNEEGHLKMMEIIFNFLQKGNLISCK